MTKRILTILLGLAILFQMTACAAESTAAKAFTDIKPGDPYEEAISYCLEKGLMRGTSDTTFEPEETLTRAMIAAILHRANGEPTAKEKADFDDVEQNTWYAAAVDWTAEEDIMQGYGNGRFGATDPISREQLELVIHRFNGETAVWVGDPARSLPATRGETAQAFYEALKAREDAATPSGSGSSEDGAASLTSAPPSPSEEVTALEIVVGSKIYTATLADTEAARQFVQRLPMTVSMSELNGNEKYYYMDDSLSASAMRPGTINTGDLMLFGSDCLVLFYQSFSSSYSYTPLGKLDDPTGLAQAVGSGGITVTFRRTVESGSNGSDLPKLLPESISAEATVPIFDFKTKTVKLNSGYTMPINGLGTYSLTGEICVASIRAALESGVRLIDTAYMYHNEEEVGRAIRESGVPREEIFVITKLYPGSQYSDPEQAIQDALDKLNIGYIDMMLLHHPGTNDVKAYKAMEQAVADGKIRSIGLSNWYVEELEDFLPQVDTVPALVQNEIHPYYQENDVIPYIQSLGAVTQGWYPLGGRGHTAELLGNETISAIAQAHGVSSAQVILRWNLQKGVVVIPGSSNPDHIRENTELYHFELTEEEMAQINALDRGEKHDWY